MKIQFRKPIIALLLLAFMIATIFFVVVTLHADRPILLEGTVVTPEGIIPDGWILIRQGRLNVVSASKPNAPDAVEIDTQGIIFPGLIDLHNHVSYNVFPRWQPPHLFSDRYEWRSDPAYLRQVKNPYADLIQNNSFCDMNTYGELRALAGGTTSILATAKADCINGLVRNLDFSSGFYNFLEPDSAHIRNEIEARSTTAPSVINAVRSFLADSRSEMFIVHLAEGTDETSLEEFHFLQQQDLLTNKTALIHGIALTSAEFHAMQAARASLVWSPRSNIDLYGTTADISAALDAGVRIALAPDWSITGSDNLLDELHYAAQWNTTHLSGRLTDQQLDDMVTTLPAQIAGIDDEVGTIREGLYADLLIISGDRNNPYHALIQAQARDVQLVLINGQPIYGAPSLMNIYWSGSNLDQVDAGGSTKMMKLSNSSTSFNDLVSKLQAALTSQGTSLAPLTENR